MTKRTILLLLTVAMLCLPTACSKSVSPTDTTITNEQVPLLEQYDAQRQELIHVTMGYMPIPGNALFMIAKDKGFFEEEGIDAELLMFKASGEAIPALVDGKLDTGCLGTTAIMARIAQGDDITIYGGQMSEGSGIITLPENKELLSDFSNYKGKKLGVVRMSTGDVLFRYALINAGLTIGKDVEVIELDSPATLIEATKKGEIDAAGVWIPHLANGEANGLEVAVFSGDVLRTHPCARMVAMTEKMEANPDLFVKIQKACIKAYDVYQNSPQESIDIMLNYIDLDRVVLEKEAYRNFSTSPSPNLAGCVEFWNEMKAIDYIDSDLDINSFVDTETYAKALDEVIQENQDNNFYLELKNSDKAAEQ